ncbi:M4 family metallopeptidase [Demequina sp. SYSU T00192]|uniref:Neutral metalloproteinase n=1 Tax=Demequina litoralis TaxID=3051660 RepID=A0ABT8G815_9MICO|nr:M4 family metallopeptidase [Demequina sp. SYSU T00192]MDN4475280.1 M4 family metallopeptidase [Demequina sp. SYSU T00192]
MTGEPRVRHVCTIVPDFMLEAISHGGSEEERDAAVATLAVDHGMREHRLAMPPPTLVAEPVPAVPHKNRRTYTADNGYGLPGRLVRGEGDPVVGDEAVDEAHDGLGATFDLFWDVFARNSIDDGGMDLVATVHYGVRYNNAFWDGEQMVFGDGDGVIFNRFTIAVDVEGHELAHGVTAATANLEYRDQPGALNESLSDCFGSMVKQRSRGQTAAEADWLIGEGLLAPGIHGVALRSMKDPGTAFDDARLGKDPQPAHMDDYVDTTQDNGGVHINSGIPNRAFYLACIALGGSSWERAGRVWYATLTDPALTSTASFLDFATLTVHHARELYDVEVRDAVAQAWADVGIVVEPPPDEEADGEWQPAPGMDPYFGAGDTSDPAD